MSQRKTEKDEHPCEPPDNHFHKLTPQKAPTTSLAAALLLMLRP
jgi:hypothetical protein